MELTEGEKLHPLWIKFLQYVEARLLSNRVALELAEDEKKADKLRGRIEEDKLFLSLNDEVPETIPNVEL